MVVMCLLANADVQRMVLVETNKYSLVSRDCRRHTRGLALYLLDKQGWDPMGGPTLEKMV